jgi:uncharacterized membrane-anchored protein
MTNRKPGPRLAPASFFLALGLALAPTRGAAETGPAGPEGNPAPRKAPEVQGVKGPAPVDLGDELAKVDLGEEFAFTGPAGTRDLLHYLGNPTHGSELGLVVPRAQGEGWLVIFEWNPIGYVKDDERDKIDADALLSSIRDATERGNKKRKELGGAAIHVTGWTEPPHYDVATHNLTWALLGKDDEGAEFVNYNVRVLGRSGVMSVTLVDSPERLAAAKPKAEKLIAAFSYKRGKTYAEWVPGDKVAQYGLTALVAAGAGAAAAKLGLFAVLGKLLAKFGKAIALGFAALGGVVAKFWRALRGKASARPAAPPTDGTGPTA